MNVDYFTDAIRYTQVRVLEIAEEQSIPGPAARAHGDVLVRSQVVGFKKIKFFTNENVGSGKLELPENEMHTTAFWLTLGHELAGGIALHPFRAAERHLRIALCPGVDGDAAADVRPAGSWHSCRRAAAERGFRDQLGGLCGTDASIGDNGILRTQPLSLRRVSRRHWIQRATLSDLRRAAGTHARTDQRPARARTDAPRVSARPVTKANVRRKWRWRSLSGCVSVKPT